MKGRMLFLTSLLFTLMIILLIANTPSHTGFATFATSEDARTAINLLSADSSLGLLSDGAQICAVVEIDNSTTYYYRLTKTSAGMDIQETYCADPGQDNLIVKFNSYDDLLSARSDAKAFIKDKINIGYYIFPSNYVQQGGSVQCTESFQQKYCAALYRDFTSSEIAGLGLACCANYELTPEQLAKLREIKAGKEGAFKFPAEFFFSTTGIIVVISAIVLVVIISSLVVMRPKNPLLDYVKTTRSQGYNDEDIQNTLMQSGWDEKTVNDAMKK